MPDWNWLSFFIGFVSGVVSVFVVCGVIVTIFIGGIYKDSKESKSDDLV